MFEHSVRDLSNTTMSSKCVKIEPHTEIDKLLVDTFTHVLRPAYVEVGEEKTCMPLYYETLADRIDGFEVKNTDIFIASHPKTGTTWTQEMVWMIMNDMNKTEAAKRFVMERSPFLEFQCLFDYRNVLDKNQNTQIPPDWIKNSINFTHNCADNPRIIKTHLPWSLLPRQIQERSKTPKIIYVMRNPKDTCVSFYHHCRQIEGYRGGFSAFCRLFMAGRIFYGPFWKHVLGYWEKRHESNVIVIRYEDMLKDQSAVIRRVSAFLRKQIEAEDVAALVEHLRFKNMQRNPSIQTNIFSEINGQFIQTQAGNFLRSGTVGSFRADMTPEIIESFDRWTADQTQGTGLTFDL